MLSIPTGARYPVLDLAPQRLKERTLAALADRPIALAAKQPVLFVIEDAHWIDPSSEELISAMIDRVHGNAPAPVPASTEADDADAWWLPKEKK